MIYTSSARIHGAILLTPIPTKARSLAFTTFLRTKCRFGGYGLGNWGRSFLPEKTFPLLLPMRASNRFCGSSTGGKALPKANGYGSSASDLAGAFSPNTATPLARTGRDSVRRIRTTLPCSLMEPEEWTPRTILDRSVSELKVIGAVFLLGPPKPTTDALTTVVFCSPDFRSSFRALDSRGNGVLNTGRARGENCRLIFPEIRRRSRA